MDSDSTELPDTLLQVWVAEAENRMFQVVEDSDRFVAYEQANSATTTALLTLATVILPITVHGPNWMLKPIQHERALERWPLNYLPTSASRTTGPPTHWSFDADGAMWLWPSPSAVEVMKVSGSRAFVPVAGVTSATPDFDVSMHPLIGEYLCARAYELQQNVTSANLKMSRFEGELDALQRRMNRPSKANNTVLGGERAKNPQSPTWRLRFPWE
jgi:hypothetical protein